MESKLDNYYLVTPGLNSLVIFLAVNWFIQGFSKFLFFELDGADEANSELLIKVTDE